MLWAFSNALRLKADFRISLITWNLFPVGPYEVAPLPGQWAALGKPRDTTLSPIRFFGRLIHHSSISILVFVCGLNILVWYWFHFAPENW